MNKYLIVRTDRIGDVALTLPMAKYIKSKMPDSKIDFVCSEYTAPVVRLCPYVDEVIEFTGSGKRINIKENLIRLRRKRYDNIFIVSPNFRLAFLFMLAGAGNVTGNGYRWYSFLYNSRIYEHRSKVEKHELDYNLSMLSAEFGNPEYTKALSRCLEIPEKLKERGKEIARDSGIDLTKELVVFHPGSGGSAVDLPKMKMKEIVKALSQEGRYSILITGTASEFSLCREVAEGTSANVLLSEISLEEFAGLISNVKMLISNSTGPIHIAAALDKFVIGFYPKIKVASAKRWGPYTEKGYVFEPELDCMDCTREQCERLNCMNTIDTQKVLNLIKTL